MIWEYPDTCGDDQLGLSRLPRRYFASGDVMHGGACIFCPAGPMQTLFTDRGKLLLPHGDDDDEEEYGSEQRLSVKVCDVCGWWTVLQRRSGEWDAGEGRIMETVSHACASGVLKQFDVADISAPIDDLLKYLVVRYGERFRLHPRKFEEVVGAVFANVGCRVRVTSYSRDEGIDVIVLEAPADQLLGIQVRRKRGKVGAEAIRSLAGAMIVNDALAGAFVTTSSYTRGAHATADKLAARGYPIELIDGKRFYDRLRLSMRPAYRQEDVSSGSSPFSRFVKDPDALTVVHRYDDLVEAPDYEVREWDERLEREDEEELTEFHYGASTVETRIPPSGESVQFSTLGAYLETLGREFPQPDSATGISAEAFMEARVPMIVSCVECGMSMPSSPGTPCDEHGQLYCFDCADEIGGGDVDS
jgi:hypothetical protein